MDSSKSLDKKFEKKNLRNVRRSEILTEQNYKALSIAVAYELSSYNLNNTIGFTFNKNRQLKNRLSKTIGKFNVKQKTDIVNQMVINWGLANQKNDILAAQYLKNIELLRGKKATYFDANIPAMNSFINRADEGMKLSKKIWLEGADIQKKIETFIGTGIAEGRSAAELSRDVRLLMKNPKKLFRRVRNPKGKLVLSKAARKYKPGTGIYRSSYKNALRLSRTETNMAYRMSDMTRYKKLDFVIGYRVHLSGQHPKADICDAMEGKYPKDFIFTGWHTSCFCYVTSILSKKKDFLAYLKGQELSQAGKVARIPQKAVNYLRKNLTTLASYSNKPYFLRNNLDIIQKNLTFTTTGKLPVNVTKRYMSVEKNWADQYGMEGFGKEEYKKAMALNSKDAGAILEKYGLSKDEVYSKIQKARSASLKLPVSKYKYYNEKTGTYSAERSKLHNSIIEKFLKDKPIARKGEQRLLMTGGYPGSGKSSMLNQAFPNWRKKYVHIDSDAIKGMLVKADGFDTIGFRASSYHYESSDIAEMIIDEARELNMNILYDATMKSYKSAEEIVYRFKKYGYNIEMAFADLPLRKAMERAISRFINPRDGRFVDPIYISTHQKKNSETFRLLQKYVDKWRRYSTNVARGEKPILISKGG